MSFPPSASHTAPHLVIVLSDGVASSCSGSLVSSFPMQGGLCTQQTYEQPNPRIPFWKSISWDVFWYHLLYQLGSWQETDGTLKKSLTRKILIKGLFKRWGSRLRNQHGRVGHSGFSNSGKPLPYQGLKGPEEGTVFREPQR